MVIADAGGRRTEPGAADVWAALETRPAGLTEAEAAARLRRHGANAIREARGTPLLRNFTHLMALLLWAGGAVGFLAGLPQLGVAIWLVNLINGLFSFWQEYRAERATAALRRLLPAQARVLRDGRERRVAGEQGQEARAHAARRTRPWSARRRGPSGGPAASIQAGNQSAASAITKRPRRPPRAMAPNPGRSGT